METRRLIIIGSGPAGYTAALYGSRAGLSPLLFSGLQVGGQLTTTTVVENWPGTDPEGIQGTDLMEKMREQAKHFGTEIIDANVDRVDFSKRPFVVYSGSNEYEADAVILSVGASAKWLGVPGEDALKGRGVSSCATCDGFFFRDKKIVIVGAGDSALTEAIFLTRFATSITILVRSEEMRASKILQDRAQANPKISFIFSTQVKELIGTNSLEKVRVVNSKTGQESEIEAQGLFVAIGHKPNTEFLQNQIELDEKGYVKNIPGTTRTSVEGVFACGDVIDHVYRQAIVSAGSGCMAALDAEHYLADKES